MRYVCYLLFAILLFTGCAGMAPPSSYTTHKTAPRVEPDTEHGVVCFLRESRIIGSGVTYYIQEDGKKVGVLRSGSYFFHKTSPGMHTYMAEDLTATYVSINVEAGKIYYVVGAATYGGPSLAEVSEPVARQIIQGGLDYIMLNR